MDVLSHIYKMKSVILNTFIMKSFLQTDKWNIQNYYKKIRKPLIHTTKKNVNHTYQAHKKYNSYSQFLLHCIL